MRYRLPIPERSHFGAMVLERLRVNVGSQDLEMLVQEARGASLLRRLPAQGDGLGLPLRARAGQAVARVCDVHVDEPSGRIEAYDVRTSTGEVHCVRADDTYWWRGDLYATSRALRPLRPRNRAQRPLPSAAGAAAPLDNPQALAL